MDGTYKLHTDKATHFDCTIELEGASLRNAQARLVVESSTINLMFPGNITENGKCSIPVKKMRGLLDEHSVGTIRLEVIAEDSYFRPWESSFEVVTSKKMEVVVQPSSGTNGVPRLRVEVATPPQELLNEIDAAECMVIDLVSKGINLRNMNSNPQIIQECVADYIPRLSPDSKISNIISNIIKLLGT
jgi:hypothetical protein